MALIDQVAAVSKEDLIVLKLYAGGPQDAWDIEQLLSTPDVDTSAVYAVVPSLPEHAQQLWKRIVGH